MKSDFSVSILDADSFPHVRTLRQAAWIGELQSVPDSLVWDEYDETSLHFGVWSKEHLIAAGRLSLSDTFLSLPDSHAWTCVEDSPHSGRQVAASSRLVVGPEARGFGLGMTVVKSVVAQAAAQGAALIVGHMFRPSMVAGHEAIGWRIMGWVKSPALYEDRIHLVLGTPLGGATTADG